jgi:hypothetical protein
MTLNKTQLQQRTLSMNLNKTSMEFVPISVDEPQQPQQRTLLIDPSIDRPIVSFKNRRLIHGLCDWSSLLMTFNRTQPQQRTLLMNLNKTFIAFVPNSVDETQQPQQ